MADTNTVILDPQRKKRITIIIAVVILALGLTVGLMLYFAGKRKGSSEHQINLSSPLDPEGNAPGQSDAEIKRMAGALHDEMDGVNFWGHDLTNWNIFMTYSDADVVRVNNQFNVDYQSDSGASFKEWITAEYDNLDSAWNNEKGIVLDRLSKLNID